MKKKFILFAGPCVIEDENTAEEIAGQVKAICENLDIRFIFKASYKKANRTSLQSFTGIGDLKALIAIKDIGKKYAVETITDIHETIEAEIAARYTDHLQIPAFLCRQTELLLAAGKTGCGINIKKGQFLSPEAMRFPLEKVQSTGNNNIWLCERGTTFGYNDLIVDATSISRMKGLGAQVIMDCTHATQKPNRETGTSGGDTALIETLALSAVATGADGLFIETHPDPSKSKSDSENMLKLSALEPLLERVMKVYKATR